jgi:hypothetical protein
LLRALYLIGVEAPFDHHHRDRTCYMPIAELMMPPLRASTATPTGGPETRKRDNAREVARS